MSEKTVDVVVEAIGHIEWDQTMPGADERWNDRLNVARLRDQEGHRYHITALNCYRNGTTICPAIVGKWGTLQVVGAVAHGFSCPTLMGQAPPSEPPNRG